MLLSEKIEFLCKLTNTSNKQLSIALSVDPSLISRIKNGKRKPSGNSCHLISMSRYFAQKCTSDYQRNALAETIGQTKIKMIMKKELLADIITQWLSDTSASAFQNMRRIINEQDSHNFSAVALDHTEDIDFGEKANCYAYFGNNGKRIALHNFVLYLLQYGTPCTVYISCDENLDWLMECPSFTQLQQDCLLKLMDRGFNFKRIVPKYNDIDEAVAAFSRWLPIYIQSKCETYYYPRLRDNLYHRTLVVAPGQIAICSSSVDYHADSNLTYLYNDPYIANNLASEFTDFYRKCVPLSIPYTHGNTAKPILDCLIQYLNTPGSMLTKFHGLPSLVTPPDIVKRIFGSDEKSINTLITLAEKCHKRLSEDNLTDIITIDSIQDICNGKVLCTASRLVPNVSAYYYSIREYAEHLKAVIILLNQYPNYNVIIHEDSSDTRSTICTIDTGKCYIIRINEPVTLFEISEFNIISAINEYMVNLVKIKRGSLALQRKKTIEKIQAVIDTLESMDSFGL